MARTETSVGSSEVSMDDIELLLADVDVAGEDDEVLEAADADLEEIEEVIEAGSIVGDTIAEIEADAGAAAEDDLSDIVGELKIEEIKSAAYAEQDSEADLTVETTKPAKAAKAPKEPKAAKAPKAPAAPRAAKTADALPADAFVLDTDDNTDDLEALKTAVLASKPSQKKVEEKFHNVLTAVAAGRKPSVYVTTALDVLVAKGEATSLEITAAMQAADYSIGTARSQTGQMFTLFPILKIATRSGNKLTLNPNSTLVMAISAMTGAAEPEAEAAE